MQTSTPDVSMIMNIHRYWFGDLTQTIDLKQRSQIWFGFSSENDQFVADQYTHLLEPARKGELDHWLNKPKGLITLIIALDQFSRQIYRKQAQAFAYDNKALTLAKHALEHGLDQQMHVLERIFCYLPFEHSEDLANQKKSLMLFTQLEQDQPENYQKLGEQSKKYAQQHLTIIQKFGRFPHRNNVLKRTSTPAELEYLDLTKESFGQ